MKSKNKVIIVQRIFAHYRKAVFDKIAEKYDLLVLHSTNKSGIKQINTKYSKKISASNFLNKFIYIDIFPYIIKYKPDLIIHEFTIKIISLFFLMNFKKKYKTKIILWSHGYNRRKGFNPKKNFVDKLRISYMKKADGILLYSETDKKFLSNFIDNNKIFVANNTLDTNFLEAINLTLQKEGIKKIKKRLIIKHKYNLLFIGRMIESKKPAILVEIFEKIRNKLNNDIGIHFIGDGPEKNMIENYISEKKYNDNFYFHGAIYDDEKNGELLFANDLMVIPGELGLSINHAFCFNTPVTSFKQGTDGPFHGPEINYVINNKTGYLAENNNIDDLCRFILNYLTDIKKQKEIKANIKKLISNECSIEKMIKGYTNCIEQVLKK